MTKKILRILFSNALFKILITFISNLVKKEKKRSFLKLKNKKQSFKKIP